METFLQMVARDLYNKVGRDMSRTVVVFPNKRAGLFFNEGLAAISSGPMWSPAYVSISDLFRQLSPWKVGDPIRLVCELYRVFCQETGSTETLDDFYFWGELLISDFDDVDKNMADAARLFGNLKDLRDIADVPDFLEPEQEEALREFFRNFSIERRTELKTRFLSLWDRLGDIYTHYRRRLAEAGIAYEGMMYRHVIEHLDTDALTDYDHYVFVGFNVLNRVEQAFFSRLQEAGRAWFYWDYDVFYTRQPAHCDPPYRHEAGEFIARNLRQFPNQLPESCFDVMRRPKQIRFLSAPTENAQARFLPRWFESLGPTAGGRLQETAVVLCNEALLVPVLHTLPEGVAEVNITMGFPLAQTPVYSYLNALTQLQTDGYRADTGRYTYEAVTAVLRHPYVRQLSQQAEELERRLVRDNRFYPLPSELCADAFLERLFTPQNGLRALCAWLTERVQDAAALYRTPSAAGDDDIFGQLYRESIFKAYTLVGRLLGLVDEGQLQGIRTDTFRRLLVRLLTGASIPFHGEPAIGMQVMGVLETRNLDFRNVAVLSLNEGKLPKAEGDSSFIPYNLRKAFGLTTVEHKMAVYAYYFYRLMQRAENVTLMYNTSSDGLNRGEMSRFMLQLQTEWPHDIRLEYLEAGQSPQTARTIRVDKTPDMLLRMRRRYDANARPEAAFSPSALNAYLDCRLRFYYRYVAGLRRPDEVTATIDSALFGTMFHRAAQLAYLHLTAHGPDVRREDLEALLRDDVRLQSFVDQSFRENFFHTAPGEKPEYNGTQLIHARVIGSYLRQLLRNDLRQAPFRIEGMEQPVSEAIGIDTPGGRLDVRIGGTIDRMDSHGDTLRIVDYKTGGTPRTPEDIAQLFTPADGRPGYIFQTFLYAAILCRTQSRKVAPALLYIHRAAQDTYSPVIEMGPARQPKVPVTNFALYEDEFRHRLQSLLQEIFDPNEPFVQTEQTRQCEYCDFRRLCRR